MLYKKYHRNYVKQFKKGVKFRWKTGVDTVRIEPYKIGITDYYEVRMTGNRYDWILVTLGGQLADRWLNII